MRSLVWKNLYLFRRFFRFYIQRKFTFVRLYQSCVARISAHACVWSAIMIFISSLWIVFSLSEQLKIDRIEIIKWNWSLSISSKLRKNQSTIERNEFYEWKIWRTIMKTMNENNFICIKINSWFQYDRIPSVFFSIKRFFFISIIFFLSSFILTANPFSDLIRSNEDFVSISFYHRFHTDQHFNSWLFKIKRKPRQHSFLSSIYTDQIWIFFSWNNPPKTTLYEDFWWFSYRRIFSSIFFHDLNFEFHFNSFYQWNK